MKFTSAVALVACVAQTSAFAPVTNPRQGSALNANILSQTTGQSPLDPAVIARYKDLPFPADLILAEYVWIDGDGNTRSKTRTLPSSKVSNLISSPSIQNTQRLVFATANLILTRIL
jgi:hypothetical protein